MLQQVSVFLVLWPSELDAVLHMGSHKGRIERENHFPRPAGLGVVGILGCKHSYLAPIPWQQKGQSISANNFCAMLDSLSYIYIYIHVFLGEISTVVFVSTKTCCIVRLEIVSALSMLALSPMLLVNGFMK